MGSCLELEMELGIELDMGVLVTMEEHGSGVYAEDAWEVWEEEGEAFDDCNCNCDCDYNCEWSIQKAVERMSRSGSWFSSGEAEVSWASAIAPWLSFWRRESSAEPMATMASPTPLEDGDVTDAAAALGDDDDNAINCMEHWSGFEEESE